MTGRYQLLQDYERNEWQLFRQGAVNIESIFLSLDDAIKRLPDAIGEIHSVVDVFDAQGFRLSRHVVSRSSDGGVN